MEFIHNVDWILPLSSLQNFTSREGHNILQHQPYTVLFLIFPWPYNITSMELKNIGDFICKLHYIILWTHKRMWVSWTKCYENTLWIIEPELSLRNIWFKFKTWRKSPSNLEEFTEYSSISWRCSESCEHVVIGLYWRQEDLDRLYPKMSLDTVIDDQHLERGKPHMVMTGTAWLNHACWFECKLWLGTIKQIIN